MAFDFKKELLALSERERQRSAAPAKRMAGASVTFRGFAAIDFTARDAFQFSRHPKVMRAAQQALAQEGLSTTASRLSSGTHQLHQRCETRLSELTNSSGSLLFNTRNQAVLSLASCLANERDCFVLSQELQSPFVDAAYLVDAECFFFDPAVPESLHEALERASFKSNRFVVVDAVSARTGVARNLAALFAITRSFEADVILDQSLSFGFLGTRGGGILDSAALLNANVLCSIIDFSELLGLKGSALCGVAELKALLLARSRLVDYEVPVAPVHVAAIVRALDLIELGMVQRSQLESSVAVFVDGVRQEGWSQPDASAVPVVNFAFDSFQTASEFRKALLAKGLLVDLIPGSQWRRSETLLRFILTLAHTEKNITSALEAISAVRARISE